MSFTSDLQNYVLRVIVLNFNQVGDGKSHSVVSIFFSCSHDLQGFAKQARQECAVLKNMFDKLETLYSDLADYYVFDKQKYTLEEFFSDIKAFLDNFYVSHFPYLYFLMCTHN